MSSVHINDFPIEVLRTIFLNLEPAAYLHASHTCKYWRQLTHWNYVLLWHIGMHLTEEGENCYTPFRIYAKLAANQNTAHQITRYLDSIENDEDSNYEQLSDSSIESTNDTATVTTRSSASPLSDISSTPPSPHSVDSPGKEPISYTPVKLSVVSKLFELTSSSHDCINSLRTDETLVKLYHKILQSKLVSISLQPFYRIILSALPFVTPKTAIENPVTRECVAFSPDGSQMLTVTRNATYEHFLYITQLVPETDLDRDSDPNFMPYLKSVHMWKCDRNILDVAMSRDLHCIAVSYDVGYVEVHDLGINPLKEFRSKEVKGHIFNVNGMAKLASSTKVIFFCQFPSTISYLALSANCEVLFLRSQRLGGLLVVNVETREEIDIPHYRLDLKMSLQYNDKVLALSGWNETVIFGKATPPSPTPPGPGALWEYFSLLVQNNISSYVPVERAMALEVQNAYLGFEGNENDGFMVKITLDEDELVGFVALEKIREEDDDHEDDEDEEDEVSDNESIGDNLEDEQHHEDDDEEEDTRKFCMILKRPGSVTINDLVYCISADSKRLAMIFDNELLLFVLKKQTIEDGLETGYFLHRRFQGDFFTNLKSNSNGRLLFVGNSKLLAISDDTVVMYELSTNPSYVSTCQRPFRYLKINAENNVEMI